MGHQAAKIYIALGFIAVGLLPALSTSCTRIFPVQTTSVRGKGHPILPANVTMDEDSLGQAANKPFQSIALPFSFDTTCPETFQ
ncbi:MAG: hypothetical protein M3Q07_07930, partial [Pseudobdellovibrionaceae bacterium]|nr:hypothetical protein [Pseudobdellovibrionaceae bacterium]